MRDAPIISGEQFAIRFRSEYREYRGFFPQTQRTKAIMNLRPSCRKKDGFMKYFLSILLIGLGASHLSAASFSSAGFFPQDDRVQLFQFNVATASAVTLRTLSYSGGTNINGTVVPEGGFDPYLALFDSTGVLISDNDEAPDAPPSPVTGSAYDAFIQQTLAPGAYALSLSQFNNTAIGPDLSSGFLEAGSGNFTAAFGCSNGSFCDIDGNNRTNAWAVDILNADSASGPGGPIEPVPEPATPSLVGGVLIGAGLFGEVYAYRRRRRKP